ncbi:MAG: HEAT repeat domain-containing protein [Chitinophagaceae bacterium]|nr:HEAT repeat domain-containing protein [Chitinophagaceae bacterium]
MKRIIAAAITCLLLHTACNNSEKENANNQSDTLYSGAKFNEHIRSTSARTPEEERKGFKLPEGFEIELYASEPDIGKPINIAFDAKGRIWVTQSFEYPFAASPGKGKDRLSILEDTDGDGKADKFIHFDDTLNIPIGILPVKDGAVAFSIPNVMHFTDADGDGTPESQQRLYGPFEYKDTHGMVNNFTDGYDGWIYGCHGFTNRSNIAGADGDSIHLISGNTIRFREDGSRIEHHTAGRINPFGLAFDEMGYLYSTDCHTSPLYQLIKGGDYSQWGKEEGMGFAPDMKPFENEATALAGLAYYADVKYPEAYQKNLFIGDVVASRVYRNSFSFKGSTPVGKREADFVLSEDPWFRPVDVKLGPDGAIYIADFYNSIIGHYEVPLDHPKRDRVSGRIWRITYKGQSNKKQDLSAAAVQELVAALNADNIKIRMEAANQLVNRIGNAAAEPAKAVLLKKDAGSREYIHSLWVLHRLNALTDDIIKASATHADPVIRLHTMRVLSEQKDTSDAVYALAAAALNDKDVHVRRAAVELMGRYVNSNAVNKLIAFRKQVEDFDTHMIYTIRLTLRNMLRHEFLMNEIAGKQWKNEDAAVLATVLVGVQTPASATFLYNYLKTNDVSKEEFPKVFMHIARFIPDAQLSGVITTGMEKGSKDADLDYTIFKSIQDGIVRRGGKETPQFQDWGKKLAMDVIDANKGSKIEGDQKNIDKQKFAMDIAGRYKVASVAPKILDIARDTANGRDVRTTALRTLLKLDMNKNAALAGELLLDPKATGDFKRDIVSALGEFPGGTTTKILAGIKNAEPDLQQTIAIALASTSAGKDIIFDKVKKGEMFARVLIQPKVEERLTLNISPKQQAVLKALTANLEDVSKERQALINERVSAFHAAKPAPSPSEGRSVFTRNCSPCHSIGDDGGGMIGPQLNSVGKWGVQSLSEKILDPNRNISESFRSYTIKLKDGKVMTGLFRREEGAATIYADASGKEFSVAKSDVAERKASKYTLMPDQFGTILSQEDYNALMAYLLTVQN